MSAPRAPRRVAVTGATGMIGRHLVRHLRAAGHAVHALARRPEEVEEREGVRAFRHVLPEPPAPGALEGVEWLVHAAATTRASEIAGARGLDERGARVLLEAARAAGVARVLFLSSTSARVDAPSEYGRAKARIEGLLDPERDLALRLGLVISDGGGGLFRRLVDTVSRARIVPLFGGGRQAVQPVHVEDVCRAVVAGHERALTGVLTVGDPVGLAFGDLLRGIARRLDRSVLFVPVPYGPVLLGLRAVEALRLPFPITSENLLGLREQRFHACAGDLERLGLSLLSVEESLDRALGGAGRRAR